MSHADPANETMEGVERSQQECPSESSGRMWNQHTEAQSGDTAAEVQSLTLADDTLVSAFGDLSLERDTGCDTARDPEVYLKFKPDMISNWLKAGYAACGKTSFFNDQWIDLDLQRPLRDTELEIFASTLKSNWSSVPNEVVSEQTPWSSDALLRLTFLLVPVCAKDGVTFYIRPPKSMRDEKKAMCIRIEADQGKPWSNNEPGLSGWSTHWKSGNDRKDVLDAQRITFSPSGKVLVSFDDVERFQQRSDDVAAPYPTPFSAWFASDKDQARQKALDHRTKPDMKVGFKSALLSTYVPFPSSSQ